MTKKLTSVILALIMTVSVLLPVQGFAASNYETATALPNIATDSWMRAIRGETKLTEITIPGTHDSCARKFNNDWLVSSTAKCQSLNITEQLNAGVRFLDIRCEVDSSTYSIKTVHGSADCWNDNDYYYLDYVFQDIYNWLDNHQSETVLVSIKEDDGNAGAAVFTSAVYEYIHGYGQGKYFYGSGYNYNDYWYLGKSVPTLDSVRGKCVLMNRFDQIIATSGSTASEEESGQKVKWGDYSDTSYSTPVYANVTNTNTGCGTFHVQDHYKWSTSSKISATQEMLSLGHYRGEYYINFSSTVSDSTIPNPSNLASTVNAAYPNFTYTKNKPSGIFAMDFATSDLCRYIINNNEGVSTIVTGTDGNISYTLNRLTGTLTLTGNGAMNNYGFSNSSGVDGYGSNAPWGDQPTNSLFDGQYNTDLVTSIVIGEGITTIGSYAFYGYDHVTSLTIPTSVTSMGEGAFARCSSLSSINILSTEMTSIGEYAFKDCTGLTSFYTVSTVNSIGANAFQNTPNLTMYGEQGIYSQTYANSKSIPYVVMDNGTYLVGAKGANTVMEAANPFAGKDISKGFTISFKQNALEDRNWNSSLINFSTGRNDDNRYFIIMSNGTILFNDGNGGAGGWNNCYFDINSSSAVNTVGQGWKKIDITVYPDSNGNHILDYYIDNALARSYNLSSICASGYPYGVSGNNGIFSYLASGDVNLYYGASFSIYSTMAGTAETYLDDVAYYSFVNAPDGLCEPAYFNDFTDGLGGTAVTGSPDNGKYVIHDTSDNNGRTGSASFPWGNNGGASANYVSTNESPFANLSTSNGFTVSFWQRINGNYWADKESLTFAQGGTGECKYFTIGTDGYIRFNNGNGGSDSSLSSAGLYFDYTTANPDIVKQQWQYVTVEILNDYQFRLYLNGQYQQTVTVTGTSQYQSTGGLMNFLASSSTKLYLGSFTPYWGTCSLSLDNVACFDHALTDAEVNTLYKTEKNLLASEYANSFTNDIPSVRAGSCAWMNGYDGKFGVLYIPQGSEYNDITLTSGGQQISDNTTLQGGSTVTVTYSGSGTVDAWYARSGVGGNVIATQQGGTSYSFSLTENTYVYCTLKNAPVSDYSAYDSAVLYANTFDSADYSVQSYQNLTATLNQYANLKSSSPTQVEVDRATFSILIAISDLVPYLRLNVEANGGTAAVAVNNTAGTTGESTVLFGDSITLTATPDSGYTFMGWFEQDTKRFFSTDSSYTFVITSNTNLLAVFTANDSATLTLTDDSGWVADVITKTCTEWLAVSNLASVLPDVPYSYGASSGAWAYDNAAVLSQLRSGNNVTVSAEYVRAIDPSKLPEQPVANADVPVINMAFDRDEGNDVGVFIMAYAVPEGCTVESKGMLVSYGSIATFAPNGTTLTINNKMLTSKFDTDEDIYILDIERISDFNFAVRGYVTYYDSSGNLKTAYSNQINVVN